MSARHVQLLNLLLEEESLSLSVLSKRAASFYSVKNPGKALLRDLNYLIGLEAIRFERLGEPAEFVLSINLEWPTQITETEFFRRVREMPKGKLYGFLSS
jgi:hypothetical protein